MVFYLFGQNPSEIIVNWEDQRKIYERQICHVVKNNNCTKHKQRQIHMYLLPK